MVYPEAKFVALRWEARQVAHRVASEISKGNSRTASSREITGDTLAAFAEAFWRPEFQGGSLTRTAALGGLRTLAKRLKQLGELFTRAPRVWEDFKKLVGVSSLADLPGKLKDLAKQGYDYLKKALGRAFESMPLRMFLIQGAGVNDFLMKIVKQVPGLESALGKVKAKADQLGVWLREKAPVLSTVVVVAVFCFIWMNVVEFEWNIRDLSAALVGKISLGDLLASLPGSAIGFLMNGFGFGTFTLLPAALAARIFWLYQKNYIIWDGRSLKLNEAALQRDGYTISQF